MAGRGRPRKDSTMIDTDGIEEETLEEEEDAPAPPKKPRQRSPGPKKVLSEASKGIADAGAKVLVDVTGGKKTPAKALQFGEAQAITVPTIRIVSRRLPKVLKQFTPKTKLSPEDAADIGMIMATIAKYLLRLILLSIDEYTNRKETQAGGQQGEAVIRNAPTAQRPRPSTMQIYDLDAVESDKERVGVSSNGHNPMFSAIGADFGLGE